MRRTTGRILLDGVSIEEIALPSLRAQIAMVSQNVVLFDDTIAANIAYGDEQPDMAPDQAAAQAAHLSDVIAALPDGVDTWIGDNGTRLSGGQRQRAGDRARDLQGCADPDPGRSDLGAGHRIRARRAGRARSR